MARDGERPVHILPWAAQDYRDSKVRARSMRTGDPMLRLVYLELLFAMQCQGGAVSADIDNLEDELALDPAEIERCLPILKKLGGDGRGGVVEVDGMLSNRRVVDEIQRAKSNQAQRSEAGRASRDARRAALGSAQPPLAKAACSERTYEEPRTDVRVPPNDRSNDSRTTSESRTTVGGSPSLPLPTQQEQLPLLGAPAKPVSDPSLLPSGKKLRVKRPSGAFDPAAYPFPDSRMDAHPTFRSVWGRWCADRAKRKKPLTEEACRLQLAKLATWGSVAAVASIERSLECGWVGLFPPPDDEPKVPKARPTRNEGGGGGMFVVGVGLTPTPQGQGGDDFDLTDGPA